MSGPKAMGWPGGKDTTNEMGTGKWIARFLPYRRVYVEPFAGMLGVLRFRLPSPMEGVNDLNGDLVNWWTVVRDQHEALESMLERSPRWSAELWKQAGLALETETDPVRRAYWWTLRVNWSYAYKGSHLQRSFAPRSRSALIGPRIRPLYDRLRDVLIDQTDACVVLSKSAPHADAVVYVDPPYADAVQSKLYERNTYNRENLTAALLEQAGFTAVSGYGSEWDHLGWFRHELPVVSKLGDSRGRSRTEVLWTNEVPAQEQGQLDW